MKSAARAVVIGGGVGGCSILYWLARLGCLVQRKKPAHLQAPEGEVFADQVPEPAVAPTT